MNHLLTTHRDTESWLQYHNIENYTINDDLSVDVNGSVDFQAARRGIRISQFPVKFGLVAGHFLCESLGLQTLLNSPLKVLGSYNCSHNDLTSFLYAPEYVGFDFVCHHNRITSFLHAPQYIGLNFDCRFNHFTNLDGFQSIFGHKFFFESNRIKELESYYKDHEKQNEKICTFKTGNPGNLTELVVSLMGSHEMAINHEEMTSIMEKKKLSQTLHLGEHKDATAFKI